LFSEQVSACAVLRLMQLMRSLLQQRFAHTTQMLDIDPRLVTSTNLHGGLKMYFLLSK
jgi:hypothetical protein